MSFAFAAPGNLHALQWHDGKGEMEFTDGPNSRFTEQEYGERVAPYVAAWEAGKARLEAEAAAAEAARLTAYNSPEARAARIRAERNARIAATDYLMLPDSPITEGERAAWKEYRAALRGITDLPGFPWDGVETAPWPEGVD
jgi:hypothetical protein